jgi:hypothetical protein
MEISKEKAKEEIKALLDKYNKLVEQKGAGKYNEEIKKLDAEIDDEVYKLYGISADEKKIIEESLK